MSNASGHDNGRSRIQQRCLTRQMTIAAILMGLLSRFVLHILGHGVGCLVMLMDVVTEMLCRFAFFVLAIAAHRRPGELEWQNGQQQDQDESFHRGDDNMRVLKDNGLDHAVLGSKKVLTILSNTSSPPFLFGMRIEKPQHFL